MTVENEGRQYLSAVAPPTEPGLAAIPAEPSAWPKVIGIIAIVLGAAGFLGGLYGALSPLFLEAMLKVMPPGQEAILEVARDFAVWTVASSLVGVVVAVVLLVAGIGLVRRRQWSVGTVRAWAVIKVLLVIATSVLGYMVAQAQFAAMSQAQAGAAPMPADFGRLLSMFAVVIGLVWGWALPVFVLIWFARSKVKAETASWD